MCLKGLIGAAFKSSELLHLLNGPLGAILTEGVYRLSDTRMQIYVPVPQVLAVDLHQEGTT